MQDEPDVVAHMKDPLHNHTQNHDYISETVSSSAPNGLLNIFE